MTDEIVQGIVILVCVIAVATLGVSLYGRIRHQPIGFAEEIFKSSFSMILGVVAASIPIGGADSGGKYSILTIEQKFSTIPGVISQARAQGREKWVYYGEKDKSDRANFSIVGGASTSGALAVGEIIQARHSVKIREDHFSLFDGTLLGFLSREPQEVGEAQAGDCFTVESVETIGAGKQWAKITESDC